MPPRRIITGRSQEPHQRFIEELRSLRAQRGVSLRDLGNALGWDWSLFGKMESGETLGSPEVAQALDQYYDTRGLLLTLWELAVKDPAKFRERYRRYMALEAQASAIHMYAPCLVLGLLQTAAYVTEVLERGGLSPGKELDQQVEARISRRLILEGDNAPEFRAIIDENVLRRGLPDQEAWREQLRHLLAEAERPNVTLQVLPFSVGLREMSNTDTSLLRFREGQTVAWVETGYSGELVQESKEVDRLQASYDRLRDHALSPRESTEFIARVLEEACQTE